MDQFDDIVARIDLDEDVQTAVRQAFANWIHEDVNEVLIGQRIEDGIKAAMSDWLDAESGNLRAVIASERHKAFSETGAHKDASSPVIDRRTRPRDRRT